MMEWRLRRQVEKARRRWRHLTFVWGAAGVWFAASSVALLRILVPSLVPWPLGQTFLWLAVVVAVGLVAALVVSLRRGRDLRIVARRIEQHFPELQTSLLAAMDIKPDAATGRVGYLQDQVVGQALSHAYRRGWQGAVPWQRLASAHVAHLLLVLLFAGTVWQIRRLPELTSRSQQAADGAAATSRDAFEIAIEPGNTELERGKSLLVVARFSGSLPADATLVYQTQKNSPTDSQPAGSVRIPMSKALEDPLFGGSIASVLESLTYHVEYGGARSEPYAVTVFEYPRLVRANARLKFPNYTDLEEKLIQDVRQLSAVIGTTIKLSVELNKPVVSARLVEKDGSTVELTPEGGGTHRYFAEVVLDRSLRYELQLEDDRQRKNQAQAEFVFTALPNQPPVLKLALPGRDTEVSPLEELELKAGAYDDFGLRRVGLTYVMAGQDANELTLLERAAAKERVELAHVVALEKLQAEPDQLLSYYFWAEDTGPDGEVRRTASDMYFAEVRPFEEIFRQGESPPGGAPQPPQSPNANAAQQLAELQKEIINATWKLIRREVSSAVTDAFDADAGLLVESQNSALQQAEKLAERIKDPQAMQHLDAARQAMNTAVRELLAAKEAKATPTLRPAIDAEQQAYQALLRLRAREHQVVRSQSQSSSASASSSSSRSQQQLDQLQLKEQENRYETERQAQPEEDPVEREMRQVLNRLKELARRQGDLNDRLKEIETALQAAQEEEQKEELRRQLKRLQEEQQQLLRDTEELQARMDQPQNAERMSQSREQLENAPERVRQSSEALREGMVPQAAAAGARAKEDFEQLRDDFRQQTSQRFRDEVKELTEQARQLDEREQKIAEDLKRVFQPDETAKSLRDSNQREQLSDGLAEQSKSAEQLLEQMRQTIQDAEGPQPLLAEQLYDAVRQTQQRNLSQNFEITREALRRGLMEPALQQEEAARQTISELRAGIERAAESVLEDETEALRRARGQLDELSRQLSQELTQNGQPGSEPASRDESGEASPSESADSSKDGAAESSASEPSDATEKSKSSSKQKSDQSSEKSAGKGSESQEKGSEASGQDGKSSGETGKSAEKGSASSGKSGEAAGEGGEGPADSSGNPRDGARGERSGAPRMPGGLEQLAGPSGGGGNQPMRAPFTGDGFREWSDRLRDVEEMLGDPELSGQAAQIRERARALRAESNRHSAPPNWDLVQIEVAEPLAELLDRVHLELLKRTRKDMLVPLDRDPVPADYTEPVRKYFERLGSGQ